MSNLGGKRLGAGRKPGGKNLRTIAATELVREAQERFPDYNPIAALIALAKDAEKSGDAETARQCHASVLPYTAPRFRPVECDQEAALEYEERLAEIRARHNARALKDTLGLTHLAERLARAGLATSGRDIEAEVASVVASAADIAPIVIDATPSDRNPSAGHAPAPAEKADPVGSAAQGDWTPPALGYRPLLPDRPSFVETDYSPLSAWDRD